MDHQHHHHEDDDHRHHLPPSPMNTTMAMNHNHHMMHAAAKASSSEGGHSLHSMMAMTFHGGFKEQILFDQWNTNSVGAFVGSWFLIFFVAVLYEGLKTVRDQLAKREARLSASAPGTASVTARRAGEEYERANETDLLPAVKTERARTRRTRLFSTYHLIQTLLHILQMGISYLLMLIAMTFNIYLFLAVILGAGLGHLLFGWRRTTVLDYNEHCH